MGESPPRGEHQDEVARYGGGGFHGTGLPCVELVRKHSRRLARVRSRQKRLQHIKPTVHAQQQRRAQQERGKYDSVGGCTPAHINGRQASHALVHMR